MTILTFFNQIFRDYFSKRASHLLKGFVSESAASPLPAKQFDRHFDFLTRIFRQLQPWHAYASQPSVIESVIGRRDELLSQWQADHPDEDSRHFELTLLCQARREAFETLSPDERARWSDISWRSEQAVSEEELYVLYSGFIQQSIFLTSCLRFSAY